MRLLYATGTSRRHGPRPRWTADQFDVGPDQLDRALGERIFSRAAPAGAYDLAAVVRGLPAGREPDGIVCAVDGASVSWPSNLAGCRGPRLLLVGDPLATPEGLARVLDYARREPFERVVLVAGTADAAFLQAAGVRRLHAIPGLDCAVADRLAALVRQPGRSATVACPPPHPQRFSALNLALGALHRTGSETCAWNREHAERMEFLGHCDCALVPSEHGELPPEWFEALAAGALLLTNAMPDRIHFPPLPEALWETYASPAELVERIGHLRAHPAEAAARRAAAAAWFDRHLGEAARRALLADLLAAPAQLPEFARPLAIAGPVRFDFGRLAPALPLLPALAAMTARKAVVHAVVADAVPAEIGLVARRLPRVAVATGSAAAGPVDFLAGPITGGPPTRADLLWSPGLDPALAEAAGFVVLPGAGPEVRQRATSATSDRQGREARRHLEAGRYDDARILSQAELGQPAGFADALVTAADVALETAQAGRWTDLVAVLHRLDASDPRLRHLRQRHAARRSLLARRLIAAGWRDVEDGDLESALAQAARVIAGHPRLAAAWRLRAATLARAGRPGEAAAAWQELLRQAPNGADDWLDYGLQLWSLDRRDEARAALRRAAILGPDDTVADRALTLAEAAGGRVDVRPGPARDLLVSMPETNRRHGTGVLLRRFFPDSEAFVTLRSYTNYGGVEEFGGVNLLLAAPELDAAERATRLRRLLEPFTIRRILAVPFAPVDFLHARLVHEFTGAPLCTYVMDDQTVVPGKVPEDVAQALFAASALRLTISPEMQAAYAARFPFPFAVMPPIVTDAAARRTNQWSPAVRPAANAVLVGNVWSDGQLRQLARFVAAAGLTVDWFGREAHPALAKAGLRGQGFLPEAELADRLTTYPFVLVPSGMLDGTEDNEWLTRLSLPSRMVFLLQTQIPVLVLGSTATAAGRFVERLGIGLVLPYAARDARRGIRALGDLAGRRRFLAAAEQAAAAFVLPDAGGWIWRSLAAGRALPAPFDAVYAPVAVAAEAVPA